MYLLWLANYILYVIWELYIYTNFAQCHTDKIINQILINQSNFETTASRVIMHGKILNDSNFEWFQFWIQYCMELLGKFKLFILKTIIFGTTWIYY